MLDRTAPEVPRFPVAGWSNAATETATALAADTRGGLASSGVDHFVVRTSADGIVYGDPQVGDGTVTLSEEGQLWASARACDAAGNCSRPSDIVDAAPVAMVDRTAPPVPYVYGGYQGATTCSTYTKSQWFDVGATGGDTLSGTVKFLYRGTNTAGESTAGEVQTDRLLWPLSSAVITGQVEMQFAAVDSAGNQSPWTATGIPGSVGCLA
jgi:hypothetical protein